MKKGIPTLLCAACLVALLAPAGPIASAAGKTGKSDPLPLIRVEALMIAMPQEKFIALLPDLLDKDKIEKAVPGLMDAVKRKEMILEGWQFVLTKSGQRASTASYREWRDFDHPIITEMIGTPGNFETRNLGVTLDVVPTLSTTPQVIDLNLVVGHVMLLKTQDKNPAAEKSADAPIQPDDPRYFTMKTATSISLVNGRHLLIGTHKLAEPEGYVEIVIVQANIIPSDD